MKRFVLSPAAIADIGEIEAFLDEHAPHATDRSRIPPSVAAERLRRVDEVEGRVRRRVKG